MPEESKAKRKSWSKVETAGFLACYLARKDEFLHSRKKRFAYQHILEDMIGKGIMDSSTTTLVLESKMRTLLSSYKAAKDNSKQTGATPCHPPFMTEMEEIFGDKPIISNGHTLQLGQGPIVGLNATQNIEKVHDDESLVEIPSSSKGKKRKSALNVYFEEKIEVKKKAAEKKNELREKFYENIKNMMKEKLEKSEERENKKLILLEKIANK